MLTLEGYTIKNLFIKNRQFSIYKGVRNKDKQNILLKMAIEEHPSTEELSTLQHEYQILTQLNLSNVIRAYDLIKQDDQLVLVLEGASGQTLGEYLRDQPLSLANFFKIAIELTEAINSLHLKHIIHKNINPNNILIDPVSFKIKLVDFSTASQLMQELYESIHLRSFEGTLAYSSPEQTGRMNRPIDYRTDFYSLGVTFYEMLTGKLPFKSKDPLEVIHSHLAKIPESVTSINPLIPQQVAAIINKLLAKTPEDRYVSTIGLKADLIECQKQWQKKQQIEPFTLGRQDVYDSLTLSNKLYGREIQIEQLQQTFDRVNQGNKEMLLISGFSGIGKSSLVKELYKPITQQRAYFITGKYDQLQRSTPYSAIIEAFQDLIYRLLGESQDYLKSIRKSLCEALGNNGQIIIDVIPNVASIIGPQSPVLELAPVDAQNRFRLTLQNFIRALAQPSHSLVLFLDDLQWIDLASLQLIRSLISDPELKYFLLIGAYRDNEVYDTHPLTIELQDIRKKNITINSIVVTSLNKIDIQHLLADSFSCTLDKVEPLAALLLDKTHGNPFFINQFLKVLYQKNLLTFFNENRQWQWDLSNAEFQTITEDVIDLLSFRMNQLSEESQQILQLAACIGHVFDLKTLSTISEKSMTVVVKELSEIIALNLIVPLEGGYKAAALAETMGLNDVHLRTLRYRFLHDRIQQAAYNLIPEYIKKQVHLRIGRLLLKQEYIHENDENLFNILNHFIQSFALIDEDAEKRQIAQYCLWAGQKGKTSTAYQSAKSYLEVGVHLLDSLNSTNDAELKFLLRKELAICQYLTGEFTQAEDNFNFLIKEAKTKIDKLVCYKLYCEMLSTLNKHTEAIKQGLTVLRSMGVALPSKTRVPNILYAIAKNKIQIGWRKVREIELSEIKDNEQKAIIDLISQLFNSAFIMDQNLFLLLACTSVNLSLRYGYAESTGFACVVYAFILMHALNWYEQGIEFVELYNKLSQQYTASNFSGKTNFVLAGFIDPYRYHIDKSIDRFSKSYQQTFEVGDLVYTNYNNMLIIITAHTAGKPLSIIEKYTRTALSFIDKINTYDFRSISMFYYYSFQCLTQRKFDARQLQKFENDILNDKNKTEASFFYSHSIKLCYLLENYTGAKEQGSKHEKYLDYSRGMVSVLQGSFYHAMSILATVTHIKQLSRSDIKQVKKVLRRIECWTTWCPINFQHYLFLIKAELARVKAKPVLAIKFYNKAIFFASNQNVYDLLGVANECASRFYASLELMDVAKLYIQKANDAYESWGATSKCLLLEQQYSHWLKSTASLPHDEDAVSITQIKAESIDVLSIMKSSQAFSSEIQLDKLLKKLIDILIQNAGAQRGILLAKNNGHWYVEVEGNIHSNPVISKQAILERHEDLALSLIEQVQSKEEKVLIQTKKELQPYFSKDTYLKRVKPRSIMVLPIYFQSDLRYILYLENRSISYAFTNAHVQIIKLLASQAAISLENAYLYHQATHDPLTGLVNRNVLYQLFNQSTVRARYHNKQIAILFIDIDNFKKINDTLGHEIGDQILIHFAEQIRSCLQEGDIASRIGGDEFIVMLQSISSVDQIHSFLENFIHRLDAPVKIGEHEILIASSIGISIYPNDAAAIQDLINQADITLYQVKASNKGYFQFYSEEINQRLKDEYAREVALRNAFEKKELCLYYQPIFSRDTHKLTHFEALLRWHHPRGGLIPSKDFVPLAEKTGLIVAIGEWVIQCACQQLKTWETMGLPVVPIAINVSGLQFQHRTINKVIKKILNETNVDPKLLELEFTESIFIEKSERIRNDIEHLKKMKLKLTIDDFGTYFSSLAYLKRLPIDTIKIDRSFVQDINREQDTDAIIMAIIAMAHNLKLRVIAEGIETKQQLTFLERAGVDELQGFFLGVPMSDEDCIPLLKTKC